MSFHLGRDRSHLIGMRISTFENIFKRHRAADSAGADKQKEVSYLHIFNRCWPVGAKKIFKPHVLDVFREFYSKLNYLKVFVKWRNHSFKNMYSIHVSIFCSDVGCSYSHFLVNFVFIPTYTHQLKVRIVLY